MAFVQKPAVAVAAGQELTILGNMTRSNGQGNSFADGDYITVTLPLQLKTVKWENDDPNARTKTGEYPVITHQVFHANGTPYPTPMDIPLTQFAGRRGFTADINDVIPESDAKFPSTASFTEIWNGLNSSAGQKIVFTPKKYLVYASDGVSKQERRLPAWK